MGSARIFRGRAGRGRLAACCVAALLLAPTRLKAEASSLEPEVGYNYAEIETPGAGALGGARRALGSSLTALFINPANMAAARVYHLGAVAQFLPEARRQSYGAAMVDSLVNSAGLAGGVGGTWNIQDPDGLARRYTDLRFALAYPFSDAFFVGLGGRYLWLSQDGTGPLGPSPVSGGLADERIVKGFGFDAGATIRPIPEISLAVVGNYLNDPDTGFQPTSVAGGAGYTSGLVGIEADVLVDFSTWNDTTLRAMGGGEVLLADNYPLRVGYRYDQGQQTHALGGGVGYIDTIFSAEVAVRSVVSGPAATMIFVGLTYHLESSGLAAGAGDTF